MKQMRKNFAAAAMLLCLLLTACGTTPDESAGSHTDELLTPQFIAQQEDKIAQVSGCAAIVQISVNPSFELYLDADGIVLQVAALNDDAASLLAEESVTGLDGLSAMHQLLQIAHRKGMVHGQSKITVAPVATVENDRLSSILADFPSEADRFCRSLPASQDTADGDWTAQVHMRSTPFSLTLYLDSSLRVERAEGLTAAAQQALSEYNAVGQHIMDAYLRLMDIAYRNGALPQTQWHPSDFTASVNAEQADGAAKKLLQELPQNITAYLADLQGRYVSFFVKYEVRFNPNGTLLYEYWESPDGNLSEITNDADGNLVKRRSRSTNTFNQLVDSTTYADGTSDQYVTLPDGSVYYNRFDANGVQYYQERIK